MQWQPDGVISLMTSVTITTTSCPPTKAQGKTPHHRGGGQGWTATMPGGGDAEAWPLGEALENNSLGLKH